jgi:glycoside/pentoside/hexuronide:cation symporter, GPH family
MTSPRILSYGLLGLPLAFAALPIYVHVPRYYAETAGMELALLGAILLATRLADAGIDPWLGWLADRVPRPTMVAVALLPFASVSSPCSIRPANTPPPGWSVRWR